MAPTSNDKQGNVSTARRPCLARHLVIVGIMFRRAASKASSN
jgi:hypothetical protein